MRHYVEVGDRVCYSSVFQTYAEYTAVPAGKVVTVPEVRRCKLDPSLKAPGFKDST